MALPTVAVLNLLRDIANEEINADLQHTIRETYHGVLKVDFIVIVSTALLGSAGFIVGSVGGGIWAYATSSDFRSLPGVVRDMTDEEREAVAAWARNVATERGITALGDLVTSSPEARNFLIEVMRRSGLAIQNA